MTLSVFHNIASQNFWGSEESLSGPGSTLEATITLRAALAEVLKRLEVKSIVDAPCGDMNWMAHLNYRFERFIGVDIVPAIIEKLCAKPAIPGYHFQVGNIVTDILPQADALLCRDCLVHIPNADAAKAIELWRRAGFKYIMATTFMHRTENTDIHYGGWRPVNLQAAPFNLPEPLYLIADNDGLGEDFGDKALGVWDLTGETSNGM